MAERAVLDLTYRTKKTGTASKDATRELKEFRGEADKAKQAAKGLSLETLAVGAAMAAGALVIGRQVARFVDLGLEMRRAEQALIGYTGSAEAANEALEAVSRGASGATSRIAAAQNAAMLFSLGLAKTADEAERLTRIAITLGASMGRGPERAFSDFTLMLANQSILRLDTFGISAIGVRERMQELADQGIAPLDRQTRFLMATLEEADEKLRVLDEAGFQVATSWDLLKVRIEDLKISLGEFTADGLIPLLDVLFPTEQQFVDTTDAMLAWTQGVNSGLGMMGVYDERVRDLGRHFPEMRDGIREATTAQQEAVEPTRDFAAALGEVDRNISGKIKGFIEDLQFLAAGGLEIQQAFEDLQEGVQLKLIDEDEAERQAQILFVQAQNIETELGNITADQAAKNISETLGVSLEQARTAVGNIEKGILRIPSRREIEFYIELTGPGAGFISGSSEPTGFQHGGSFVVGGMPGPDRNLVMFRATQGEQVTVTPRAGSPQPGMAQAGGGGTTIIWQPTITTDVEGQALLERFRTELRRTG